MKADSSNNKQEMVENMINNIKDHRSEEPNYFMLSGLNLSDRRVNLDDQFFKLSDLLISNLKFVYLILYRRFTLFKNTQVQGKKTQILFGEIIK